MRARDETEGMLSWWSAAGVDRADLAVRRHDGTMIWHHDTDLDRLPLAWARAENVRGAEIYVRPARSHAWPLVFLDDVDIELARRITTKYASLAIRTSPQAGGHVWLQCDAALDERARGRAQSWLAKRAGADPASISGEHLGRLAGMRNWKRDGCWVNVLASSSVRPWVVPDLPEMGGRRVSASGPGGESAGRDQSPSGRDWAWACQQLEAGLEAQAVCVDLAARAARRGRHAERYARYTVERALRHIGQAQ